MSDIVEVAAAVMLRAGGSEFLLAQRPEGKVYAGYWEFPGGKVEPGESVRDALVRELQEELGITVTACHPWLTRRHVYPHATVRLNFWQVTAWQGEIGITAPLEHSAVDWQRRGAAASVRAEAIQAGATRIESCAEAGDLAAAAQALAALDAHF
ncbi:MAG TPA: NUDIX domain-containing protein, partial [Azonexus sp.]|nr:NUDIX domain-containing protein [Azonexus sp.]